MSSTRLFASASGGKDSTAMMVYLLEQGLAFDAVFFDTGWEHAETYRYVRETIPAALGVTVREVAADTPELAPHVEARAVEIEAMLGHRSAFVRLCLHKGMFPSRRRRWCTQYLKADVSRRVVREAHERGEVPTVAVGIRRAESPARASLPERELHTSLDSVLWRPIIDWTEGDVIDAHRRAGIAPNPLYIRGARRVGCWPCIMSAKAELRRVADAQDGRADVIRALETAVAEVWRESGREADAPPTMYQAPRADADGRYPCWPWDRIAEWSRTPRGGALGEVDAQEELFGGCLSWGLCDAGDP